MTEPSASQRISILPPTLEEDLAYHDELTGLFNRRALELIRRDHWSKIIDGGQAVSLVMIDLDLFKEVNDTYGHLAGDGVLVATANALRSSFRRDDILLRYGGDEFLVVLPGAGREESEALAERARSALSSKTHFVDDDGDGHGERPITIPISFSIGRSTYPTDGTTPRELLAAADARLYADKKRRRSEGAKGRRIVTLLIVGALLLLLALLANTASRRQTEDLPSIVGTAIPQPVPRTSDDAAALRAEIANLEALVDTLRTALNRGSGQPDAVADARIVQLEETISKLRKELTAPSLETERASLPTPMVRAVQPSPDSEPASDPAKTVGTNPPEDPLTVSPAGSADSSVSQIVAEPPTLLRLEPPIYPQTARQLRREATVELEVVVGTDGRVLSVRPLGPPAGLGFDAAARRAAEQALYEPGRRNGVASEMVARLSIQFTLDR